MIDSTTLPRDLRSQVELELQPGERVVWAGQPIPGRLARGSLGIVLFGIPWTAFSIFWVTMAAKGISKSNAGPIGWLFPLFGVPFILIGIGMLSSPYWARRNATRTAYVITDRRAIIFQARLRGGVSVRSFEPSVLKDLNRTQLTDGSGDLTFAQELQRGAKGRYYYSNIGFQAVRDVKAVEEMVRALAQSKISNQ